MGSSPRKVGARHRRAWRRSTRLTATLLGVALVAAVAAGAAAAAGAFAPRSPHLAEPGRPPATSPGSLPARRASGGNATRSTGSTTSRATSASATTAPTTTTTTMTTTTLAATTTTTLAATTTTLPPPSSVLVEVLNGSGRAGAAATTASALRQDGFLLNGTGNAASFTNPVTLILYPSGEEAAAKTLDLWVLGATKLEASTSVPAGVVHLILGDSFAGTVASGNGS